MVCDLQGRLRHFTLGDIFQLLSFSGQTGTLTLMQGWNSRTITFEKGRITYIAAATRLPGIPELLLRAGRLDEEQMQEITQLQKAGYEGPIEDLLLDSGWATKADLERCHAQQLEETIYTLFLWRNCHFTFTSGEVNKTGGIAVDLASERLIMEGTRRVDEWISISPVVPSVRMIFRLLEAEPSADLGPLDRQVLALVDGEKDVAAIAVAAGLTQFETARCLYRLAQAGLVKAVPPDKVQIIELFNFLVESIYLKLVMYGYARIAVEFEKQLESFAAEHGLKVRMRGGKIIMSDLDLLIETTALIDLYKLFVAVENNKFARMFEPEIVRGLAEGLYLHVDAHYRGMMRMYEFYQIEGLLAG